MKKYKLINTETKEETLCDKVIIDGFDYYVSDEKLQIGDYLQRNNDLPVLYTENFWFDFGVPYKKVIATTNPKIDIPKVVDKAELLAKNIYRDNPTGRKDAIYRYNTDINAPRKRKAFVKGYRKSQETHPFGEEDMVEFGKFFKNYEFVDDTTEGELYAKDLTGKQQCYTTKELLQIWNEQRIKTLYYE